MGDQQKTGNQGEVLAQTFLERKGYTLEAKNYRYGKGEIDLVMRAADGWLVFVEVKARKNDFYGNPEQFVSRNQIRQIQKAAEGYLENNGWTPKIRFDIVAILLTNPPQLEHLEDAF
ncbi:MAG TPA: YraN family protein [Cytophagales bacterium]|nr:YraN family protein [Cytophagales bacterium]HAA21960.1 YraN family protein [Cytophagales bacterium]HAP61342.1 YraN family protein [Cytophagales bacterium]